MSPYRQKESKNWWVSIYLGGGRRRQVSTGTPDRDRALVIEATLRAAHGRPAEADRLCGVIRQLAGGQPAAPAVPLSQLADEYGRVADLAPSTLRKRLTDCRRFSRWAAQHWPAAANLADVNRQTVTAFCDWLRNGRRRKTYNNIRSNLQAVWSALQTRAGLAENPWQVASRNLRLTDSRHGRAFTADEVSRILAECRKHDDWYGASTVALYTGLRLGDVAGLRWQDVGDQEIALSPSKTRRHGVQVRIPLHPTLRACLDALRPPEPRADGLVFPALNRRHRIAKYSTDYGRILRAAGVTAATGETLGFHSWRHTFRTRLAAAGVPADVARKLGGWTQEATAARYDHDLTQLQDAIGRLP